MPQLDEQGRSPLYLALKGKQEGVASTLVSHNCDLNARQSNGLCILHSAILEKDSFSATFLIQVLKPEEMQLTL